MQLHKTKIIVILTDPYGAQMLFGCVQPFLDVFKLSVFHNELTFRIGWSFVAYNFWGRKGEAMPAAIKILNIFLNILST
jgi:hypothetical protein